MQQWFGLNSEIVRLTCNTCDHAVTKQIAHHIIKTVCTKLFTCTGTFTVAPSAPPHQFLLSASYFVRPLFLFYLQFPFPSQVIVSVWVQAQTKKTLDASTSTSHRPETTSMSGNVASACQPERSVTDARWKKIASGHHPLLPSSTTLSTSAVSWETRSKVDMDAGNL